MSNESENIGKMVKFMLILNTKKIGISSKLLGVFLCSSHNCRQTSNILVRTKVLNS